MKNLVIHGQHEKGSKNAMGLGYQITACSQEKLHDDDNS